MSKRTDRARSLDEEIARRLEESRADGELEQAPSFGKPLPLDDGWDETPEALRMPFKILKDAGVRPPEIELFHERAALRARILAEVDGPVRDSLRARLVDLELTIALRLEALKSGAKG
jgi:hypothetical protein